MKLCELPDFRDIVQAVAADLNQSPQFVERDYYLAEALRVAASTLDNHVIRVPPSSDDVIAWLTDLAPRL